jgi:uncharacterized protein YdhG (YjbR/CyaY superfamily)
VPEPQRSTLVSMRATIADLLPDAEQGIAYGIPCFTIDGSHVAGFGSAQGHCTYFPMSGSITAELAGDLSGYRTAKGSIRFPADQPLPTDLITRLIEARRREIARTGG